MHYANGLALCKFYFISVLWDLQRFVARCELEALHIATQGNAVSLSGWFY